MWNVNVVGKKEEISALIDSATSVEEKAGASHDDAERKQMTAAKALAQQVLNTIPGPQIVVSMAGNSHGRGDKGGEPGTSNEFINVSVSQKV